MQLSNSFRVPVPPEDAWAVLLDVERIAPCVPGAQLEGPEGDGWRGVVKVKLGPITVSYAGTVRFTSTDPEARVAVIEAAGSETRGNGTARANVTTSMRPDDGGTVVDVVTDLVITGRPAQFGRGVMAEVAGRLIDQFAACLADEITGEPAAATGARAADGQVPAQPAEAGVGTTGTTGTTPETQGSRPTRRESEPVDLLATAGGPVLRRIILPAAGFLAGISGLVALVSFLRRRRS